MEAARTKRNFSDTVHSDAPEPVYSGGSKPVSALLKELVSNTSLLVRQEVMLARAEIGEKTHSVVGGIVSIASGFILALAALIILLDAIVFGLAKTMPMWAAAAIVGGVVAVIAAIFIYIEQSRLSAANMTPNRSIRSVQDDAQVIREKV